MPRHFTDEEKTRIKNDLLKNGKELIIKYGLRKTTISDLTKAVGIAKGTFYQFFDSKSHLFLEIFEQESKKLRSRYKVEVLEATESTKNKIKRLIHLILDVLENNPIFAILYDEDERKQIFDSLKDLKADEHRDDSVDNLDPIITLWKAQGLLEDYDNEIIIGVIRAVTFISLHKKEIGHDIYPEVIDLVITFVSEGLEK